MAAAPNCHRMHHSVINVVSLSSSTATPKGQPYSWTKHPSIISDINASPHNKNNAYQYRALRTTNNPRSHSVLMSRSPLAPQCACSIEFLHREEASQRIGTHWIHDKSHNLLVLASTAIRRVVLVGLQARLYPPACGKSC